MKVDWNTVFFIFSINIVSITSLLIKLMDDDQADWQKQYDRIFLQFPVIVTQEIYQLLPIQPPQKKQLEKASTHLPELFNIYNLLQNFINDHRNWAKRSCSEVQIGSIEQKINNLMIILQYQKLYGCQLWPINERRMQASIIHFYILMKMFVVALIPTNCNSLMHANTKDKLMLQLIKLQAFVNQIISFTKPIHSFMYGPNFQNERELTDQFFKEFFEFFKKMPKIKKQSLSMIPQIMDYVNVCLQIDAIQLQPKINRRKRISNSKSISKKNDRSNNFFNRTFQDEENNKQKREFFRFDERIRAHTQFRNQKKLTITSIQTKEKSQSNDKSRSPSLDRSLTIFQSQRLKRSTMIEPPRRQPEGRNRNPTANIHFSRRSRQRTRQLSIDQLQCQQQRDTKIKKKKIAPLPIKLVVISEQVNFEKGKSRGWGIIREQINKKIAQRKIKKLILF